MLRHSNTLALATTLLLLLIAASSSLGATAATTAYSRYFSARFHTYSIGPNEPSAGRRTTDLEAALVEVLNVPVADRQQFKIYFFNYTSECSGDEQKCTSTGTFYFDSGTAAGRQRYTDALGAIADQPSTWSDLNVVALANGRKDALPAYSLVPPETGIKQLHIIIICCTLLSVALIVLVAVLVYVFTKRNRVDEQSDVRREALTGENISEESVKTVRAADIEEPLKA